MKESEAELTNRLAHRFREAFMSHPRSEMTVKREEPWKIGKSVRRYDLIIYQKRNPLAIVEVKKGLESGGSRLSSAKAQVLDGMNTTNARFGIVTDGVQFFITDRNDKGEDFDITPFQRLITTLVSPPTAQLIPQDNDQIVQIFRTAVNNNLPGNENLVKLVNQKPFGQQILLDNNSHTIRFKDVGGSKSFENGFFSILFPDFKEKQICRYTSLNTLYSMLNYNSFRMSGLVGMNDRSEVNYVDEILERAEKPLRDQHHQSISAINNRYITSCTRANNRDNLTMWRLYGDDSQGVCLTFNTRLSELNDHVILHPVKYANENGQHPELEMIKEIKTEVQSLTGYTFEFGKLRYWKHFFKPFEYRVEEEIRLLVIDNEKLIKEGSNWVMTYAHSIFNPTIDFLLNSSSFPIHLKEIMLGPKCPEQEINKVQIEEMIRRKRRQLKAKDVNLSNLNVVISDITHYR